MIKKLAIGNENQRKLVKVSKVSKRWLKLVGKCWELVKTWQKMVNVGKKAFSTRQQSIIWGYWSILFLKIEKMYNVYIYNSYSLFIAKKS